MNLMINLYHYILYYGTRGILSGTRVGVAVAGGGGRNGVGGSALRVSPQRAMRAVTTD